MCIPLAIDPGTVPSTQIDWLTILCVLFQGIRYPPLGAAACMHTVLIYTLRHTHALTKNLKSETSFMGLERWSRS